MQHSTPCRPASPEALRARDPDAGVWPDFQHCLPDDDLLDALVDTDGPAVGRFRALYDRLRPNRVSPLPEPTIPRVIHQIWLGSPLPRRLARYSDTWRRRHPDWEMKLWTDADVARLDFPSRDLFEAATCWGQKSDLLRIELLNAFGGVYVDLDYECYRPLDVLVERYDFFSTLKFLYTAHLGWPAVWPDAMVVCNSLLGARPGHPLLGAYLERVRASWNESQRYELREDELMPIALAAMGGRDKAARIKETGVRTFLPFGEVVAERIGTGSDRDLILPPLFFNPVMAGARTLYVMPEFWQRCRARGIRWPSLSAYTRPHPLSIAKHVSESRWV